MKKSITHKMLFRKDGVALVTVMSIIVISTIIILGVIYYIGRGIQTSAIQRTYQSAKEASHGGIEVFTKELIPQVLGGNALSAAISSNFGSVVTAAATDTCFTKKVSLPTSEWGEGCDNGQDPKILPDLTFSLKASGNAPSYTVYTKIIDTARGNSSTSGIRLEGLGVVTSGTGMISPPHYPYLYNIEFQGERTNNPSERANLEVLYAY